MSSQCQAVSETARLMGHRSGKRLPTDSQRFSPETLLIPVALASKLAARIPFTTHIELVRRWVCKRWSVPHGDPDDPVSPELCAAPEVEQHFAIVVAMLGVTASILSMAVCGILSRISSRWGRKPAFLLVLATGIVGHCLVPGSRYMPHWLADSVFLVGTLLGMLSGYLPLTYVVNMYIVDVCDPEDRTTALSKMGGWTALGTCISYALGGSLSTGTGKPQIVFYASSAIFSAVFVYVVFVLPESFSETRRDALSRLRQEPPERPSLIFEPLRMLIPTRKPDGSRNWRLTWCAAHTFVFMIANGYVSAAWLVLVTSKYDLTPAETGLFLSVVNVTSVIALVLIVPPLVRFLRPYYIRQTVRPLTAGDATSDDDDESGGVALDLLDVHLAFASCVVVAVAYSSAAASTTRQGWILSSVGLGFAAIHVPTMRSLAAGSVDPLEQGDVLAAIEIVSNAGCVLSPLIMGSVLGATIHTTPLLVFHIHTVVVLASSALLFLVRDGDRYWKAREASTPQAGPCVGRVVARVR